MFFVLFFCNFTNNYLCINIIVPNSPSVMKLVKVCGVRVPRGGLPHVGPQPHRWLRPWFPTEVLNSKRIYVRTVLVCNNLTVYRPILRNLMCYSLDSWMYTTSHKYRAFCVCIMYVCTKQVRVLVQCAVFVHLKVGTQSAAFVMK